jgi:hypothetical protein
MPGNELDVAKYLFNNLGKIDLPHLGIIKSIGSPIENSTGHYPITTQADLVRISSPDSSKKADVYLNGVGVSIKQSGGSFAFNRLQRAEAPALFKEIGFSNVEAKLARLDREVRHFHEGGLSTRSRPWEDFFTEPDFKTLLEYLMMRGSPNLGISKHPAKYILEASEISGFSLKAMQPSSQWKINVYSFEEYFSKYKYDLKIGVRRQWYGQKSKSEHGRATGLINKPGNEPWIFSNVAGHPRDGWREEIPEKERKTVYFLMVEKLVNRNSGLSKLI